MKAWVRTLPLWLAALWWGSLTVIGGLVVPLLFHHLPTPAMAGGMAAHLFTAQTWVTVACGLLLLVLGRGREGDEAGAGLALLRSLRLPVLAGLLPALLSEFAVAPRIVARENLALWHSLGSLMFLVQWCCAAWTLGRLARGVAPQV
jgi:hypothetical protein